MSSFNKDFVVDIRDDHTYPEEFATLLQDCFSEYIRYKVAKYWTNIIREHHPDTVAFEIETKSLVHGRLQLKTGELRITCTFTSSQESQRPQAYQLELFTGFTEVYRNLFQSVKLSLLTEYQKDDWDTDYSINYSATVEAGGDAFKRVIVTNKTDMTDIYPKLPAHTDLDLICDRNNVPKQLTLYINNARIHASWADADVGDGNTNRVIDTNVHVFDKNQPDFESDVDTASEFRAEYEDLITYYLTHPLD